MNKDTPAPSIFSNRRIQEISIYKHFIETHGYKRNIMKTALMAYVLRLRRLRTYFDTTKIDLENMLKEWDNELVKGYADTYFHVDDVIEGFWFGGKGVLHDRRKEIDSMLNSLTDSSDILTKVIELENESLDALAKVLERME